uniref:G-protein coupled receptors family 1 profile domain-containing protein n=1 Tax=Knipowitschia caucasica TaxID=637954 RepID=A0AAV2MRQ0_KNICA
MAAQSLQHKGNKTGNKIGNASNAIPKTFQPHNHSFSQANQSFTGMEPFLHVEPEDPATAFTKGVLSNWIIPSTYALSMLLGIPSNAYIVAFLRTIACISVKRYLAVVKPFLYRRLATTSLSVWACLIVWLLFGAAIVPELLVRQSYYIPNLGVVTCHDILPSYQKPHSLLVPFRLALVFLGFIVPFFVCIYAHVSVVYHLRQSGCDWKPFIKVSSLVFVIFVVCFLPSGTLHITHYICLIVSGDDQMYTYYRAAVCLCCFHSCLDPLLCLLLSRTASSELHFISLRGTTTAAM